MADGERLREFNRLMDSTAKYYGFDLGPSEGQIYWKHLSKYTTEQLMNAIDVHISQGRFFPKVAELVKIIDESGRTAAPKNAVELHRDWQPSDHEIKLYKEFILKFPYFASCIWGPKLKSLGLHRVGDPNKITLTPTERNEIETMVYGDETPF